MLVRVSSVVDVLFLVGPELVCSYIRNSTNPSILQRVGFWSLWKQCNTGSSIKPEIRSKLPSHYSVVVESMAHKVMVTN